MAVSDICCSSVLGALSTVNAGIAQCLDISLIKNLPRVLTRDITNKADQVEHDIHFIVLQLAK